MLSRWEHLDRIPAAASDWDVPVRGGATLAATLRDHRAEALLYRRLATLNLDAAINGRIADLEWRGARRAGFTSLCKELGFNGAPHRVHRWDETG